MIISNSYILYRKTVLKVNLLHILVSSRATDQSIARFIGHKFDCWTINWQAIYGVFL